MDNIIDLIATDSSAAEITDNIKNALFSKASERIDGLRPEVAATMFDAGSQEEE
jgi:hypothetical protein